MDSQSPRQQIVDKIKDNSNILVTVSESPTVDELTAALGLTLMLNKMNKHSTAVFSGKIPAAIRFLEPDKTFEDTVDSLRDFIIALNKDKADHLRYKVDGDVVKIFITPYRTTINDKDLEFSQGDYNVELVLALGVKSQENLDKALESHGRIFHDATVATISAGSETSKLGSIDWSDRNASSLSEMMVGLAEALKSDKSLLDDRVSTAFLTGIVAKTDRFSNNLTSSKVMTVAAELMETGANQQLIAAKLEEANEITNNTSPASERKKVNGDGSTDLNEDTATKVSQETEKTNHETAADDTPNPQPEEDSSKDDNGDDEPPAKKDGNGELSISHEKEGSIDDVARQTSEENQNAAAAAAEEELRKQTSYVEDTHAQQDKTPEQELADSLEKSASVTSNISVADLQNDLRSAASDVDQAAERVDKGNVFSSIPSQPPVEERIDSQQDAPSMGGTLNATTEEAADDKRREEQKDRNHTILSHEGSGYMGDSQPTYNSPLNSTVDTMNPDNQKSFSDPMAEQTNPTISSTRTITPPTAGMTLAQIDSENRSPHEQARNDIQAAYAAGDDQYRAAPAAEAAFDSSSFENQQSAPAAPPMPDFSTLPPLPPMAPTFDGNTPSPQTEEQPPSNVMQQPMYSSSPSDIPASNPFVAPSTIPSQAPAPSPNDPGQFRIPGA